MDQRPTLVDFGRRLVQQTPRLLFVPSAACLHISYVSAMWLSALASVFVVSMTFAQEAAVDIKLEEITVTARRVEENLQRVPVAVTAFEQERLERLDIRDLMSIANTEIPGVDVCCNVFQNNLISIRGIVQGAPTYFADAPVSPDGYSNFFDIENFQVLKGPQGTLFGEAAAAGAFIYQPHKPGEKLGGYVSVSAGDYSRRTVEGALDVPLVNDHLFVRLAAISSYREGYVHDLSNNKYYGDQDYYTLRPSVTWKINDNLENYTLYQYSYAQDSGQAAGAWTITDINFNTNQPSLGPYIVSINGGNVASYKALAAQMLALQLKLGPYTSIGTSSPCASPLGPISGPQFISNLTPAGTACPGDWFKDSLLVNTTSWRFADEWSAKNIFHYDRSKRFQQPADGDLSPLILFAGGDPRQTEATKGPNIWSDEVQVQGKFNRFDIQAGTYHTGSKTDPQDIYNGFLLFPTLTNTSSSSSSHAIYGQSDIHLNEFLQGLTATVGLRYNVDRIEQTSYTFDPSTGALLGQAADPRSPAGHATFHNISYTAGLQYQYTPDTMFFITNSRGFSAGGFQSTPGIGFYQPEVLTNLESGIKTTFDVGSAKVRLNASYYYGWFDNVQATVWSTFQTPITNTQSVGFLVSNAAKAHIQGVDAELTVVPTRNIEFGGFLAYANDKYTKYEGINPFTNQQFDYSGTSFLFVPTVKFGLRATYHLPLPPSIGAISLTADYSHRGTIADTARQKRPTDPANPTTGYICARKRSLANGYPASVADGGTAYIDCIPPAGNLDLSAQWRDFLGSDNLTMSFTMTNVTGNEIAVTPAALDSITGYTSQSPAVPRMFFLNLRYSF